MAHSGLSTMIALHEAEQRRVMGLLLDVAATAFHAADDSEDDGNKEWIKVDRASFDKLSKALDALDDLPDDQPGYVMDGPAKARWALRCLLEYPYLSSAATGGVTVPAGESFSGKTPLTK